MEFRFQCLITGLSRPTAENHFRLLRARFLVVRRPSGGKNLRSRVSAQPEVHVVKSGLTARLLRLSPPGDPTSLIDFGHLLEIFVVGELRKQASWLEEPVTLGHWRTSGSCEWAGC